MCGSAFISTQDPPTIFWAWKSWKKNNQAFQKQDHTQDKSGKIPLSPFKNNMQPFHFLNSTSTCRQDAPTHRDSYRWGSNLQGVVGKWTLVRWVCEPNGRCCWNRIGPNQNTNESIMSAWVLFVRDLLSGFGKLDWATMYVNSGPAIYWPISCCFAPTQRSSALWSFLKSSCT